MPASSGTPSPSTTAGYVKRLGRRPEAVAKRAAAVLDGHQVAEEDGPDGVPNHPGDLGSNGGSNGSDSADAPADGDGP